MSPTLPLSPSGISSVDANWGGLTKGGTYLLIGHARTGRPRHVMTTVRAAVEAGEHCLLISARPQAALIAQAAEIGFDLPRASQLEQVRLLKSPHGKELAALGDEGLTRALEDLIQLAQTHQAGRVVMDDFSSFVQFRVFGAFAEVFRGLVRDAAVAETTFVLGLGEPANEASKNLLRFVEREVAGTIHATSDVGGENHFELIPGSADVSLTEPLATPFAPISPFMEVPVEASLDAPVQPEAPRPGTAPPGLEGPTLPPFELSIPEAGGDGSDLPVDTPDLTADLAPDLTASLNEPPPTPDPVSPSSADPPPQTSGDTAWAQITPVSPEDAPFPFDELDTFLSGRARLDPGGYFVDSAAPTSPQHSTSEPEPNLEKAASAVQQAAYPKLFEPISPANPTTDFRQALADAYAQRETAPFLVMALRIPEDDPYADVFPAVTEGVRIGVGQAGTLLTGSYRLIALIPNAGADVARNVFAILKAHLRTVVPDKADAALQHVNAMAVPNGEPFKTADELFGYAFES